MADVRSLLRSERVSRRITHANATYTESGKLVCTACNLQIKTESLWENHVASPQHIARAQQLRANPPPQSKKRKAGEDEDEGRKRVKAVPGGFVPEGFFDATQDEPQEQEQGQAMAPVAPVTSEPAIPQDQRVPQAIAVAPVQDVNEDEWAAFEREIAVANEPVTTNTNSAAVISAAPLTAEELAAQAREDQIAQRGAREAEIEADTEDAARALEQEFDEMEDLDERVRRLREKREALRIARLPDTLPDAPDPVETAPPEDGLDQDNDDEDDDEDNEFDDWTFGAR